jgi:hypothetical protein
VDGIHLVSHWMFSFRIVCIQLRFGAVIEVLWSVSLVENPIADDENPHTEPSAHPPRISTSLQPHSIASRYVVLAFRPATPESMSVCGMWRATRNTASSPHESQYSSLSPAHVMLIFFH